MSARRLVSCSVQVSLSQQTTHFRRLHHHLVLLLTSPLFSVRFCCLPVSLCVCTVRRQSVHQHIRWIGRAGRAAAAETRWSPSTARHHSLHRLSTRRSRAAQARPHLTHLLHLPPHSTMLHPLPPLPTALSRPLHRSMAPFAQGTSDRVAAGSQPAAAAPRVNNIWGSDEQPQRSSTRVLKGPGGGSSGVAGALGAAEEPEVAQRRTGGYRANQTSANSPSSSEPEPQRSSTRVQQAPGGGGNGNILSCMTTHTQTQTHADEQYNALWVAAIFSPLLFSLCLMYRRGTLKCEKGR